MAVRRSASERQAMIKAKNVVAELRRDVSYVGRAIIAIVFISFATIVVAAALHDLWAIRH
jgi:hypothetical protein